MQTQAQQLASEQQTAQYTIATMETAAGEYQKRIGELEAYAVEAEGRIAELNAAIETAEKRIVDLGGEVVPVETTTGAQTPAETEAPAQATNAPAEGGAPLVVVPQVQTPEILTDDSRIKIDEIYSDIDAIVNGTDSSMTDEEKVQALDALKAELADYVGELNAALEEIAAQESALAASVDSIETLEAELTQAQARVEELTAAIADGETTIADLEAQLQELTAQSESDIALAASQIEELTSRIAAEEEKVADLTAQLEAANAELAARIAELEAYRLNRELVEGDAYTASTLGDVLKVADDGVSVEWSYTNDSISGNAVVLSILLDGEELYRSGLIQPGESLEGVALNRALEAGSYEAVAVMSVCDAEGAAVSSTRVPVTIQVG